MVKLLAFDIDNTLAGINQPILSETVDYLQSFENRGVKIAFVSGKPAIYISGMVRQIGLEEPIVIGENGLNIYYSCHVPPKEIIDGEVEQITREILFSLKEKIAEAMGEQVWFQPNAVSVTAFPKAFDIMPKLQEIVHSLFDQEQVREYLVFYQHSDSIDIAPKNVSKGSAMKTLLKKEGWTAQDVIAIGDGENDIPMFENAGYTVGVNFKGEYPVDVNVTSIQEAMREIEFRISK
ncbi:HAD family hydrolase [Neobacillus niacini]|uniref:HAD family hydrolase n=1 Tax=Neobacillus niacini TaxID=86668 RepID=UPI003982D6F2